MLIKTSRETLEMMARTTPDILIDFIQTDNILGESWKCVAIEIATNRLTPDKTVPMLLKMLGNISSNVRATAVRELFRFKKLEEISVHLTWFQKQRR